MSRPCNTFESLNKRLDKTGECWIVSGYPLNNGYGKITVAGKMYTAHRVAYALAHGLNPSEILGCVLHSCDNRLCCNPDHLFLGTRSDNAKDRHSKGRDAKGFQLPHSKIADCDKDLIRKSHDRTVDLAEKYGVDSSSIHQIRGPYKWASKVRI